MPTDTVSGPTATGAGKCYAGQQRSGTEVRRGIWEWGGGGSGPK